jgi:hypothetical protein
MPDGAALFETSGAWEDFSTPSRDLRLLNCDRCGSRFSRSGRGGRSATRCRSTRALRTSKMNCEVCSHRSLRRGKSRIPQQRLGVDPCAQGCNLSGDRSRRGVDMQTACVLRPARENDKYGAWFHERRWPGASVESRCGVATVRPNSRRGDVKICKTSIYCGGWVSKSPSPS